MDDRRARWAATAALAFFVVIGALSSTRPVWVVAVAVVVAVGASLLMTSTGWPLLVWAFVAAAAVGVLCGGTAANIGWFALCVLAGWCVFGGSVLLGVVFGAVAIIGIVVQWTQARADAGWASWIAGVVFTVAVCAMGRRQAALVEQLRAAQAGLADQARADERAHIARELHDVIAHSLTVSLLHVTGARLAVEEDPHEAGAALAEAERLGRQSLTEVRRTVGLLRDAGVSELDPLPGAERLPELIEGFNRAGARIEYRTRGDVSRLGATLGLTVYRITQEALTNAARHAPTGRVSVELAVTETQTRLQVQSTGPAGAATPGRGSGHGPGRAMGSGLGPGMGSGLGIVSMTERAESVGGTLVAGPVESGWQVSAHLPGPAQDQPAGPSVPARP